MKFAKHLARAMQVSEPEWHPYWINYKYLKKLLRVAKSSSSPSGTTATVEGEGLAPKPSYATRSGSSIHPPDGRQQQQTPASVAVTTAGLRRPRPWEAAPAGSPAEMATPTTSPIPTSASVPKRASRETRARVCAEVGTAAPAPDTHRYEEIEPARSAGRPLNRGEDRSSTTRKKRACCDVVDGNCDRPTAVAIPVGCCRGSASATEVALGCCATNAPLCAASAVAAAAAAVGGGRCHRAVVETKATGDDVVVLRNNAGGQLEQHQQCKCPFFRALLREVDMCRDFFLENERALEVRTRRLQLGLEHLRRPDLSRLSTVKGAHMKLMKACVNFYRDALLLEDFAMLNFTAVIKLLKKRDKIAGTSDKLLFMAEVMADQPFTTYPGVAKRVVQVEQIFRDIENMCFLRTGEGMKSVMKNELTVIEAFMQLAQESRAIQNRELDGGNLGGPPLTPAWEAKNEHQPCPSALISPQAIDVSWCEQSGGGAAASGAHGSGHGSPPAGTASSNSRDRTAATLQPTAALRSGGPAKVRTFTPTTTPATNCYGNSGSSGAGRYPPGVADVTAETPAAFLRRRSATSAGLVGSNGAASKRARSG